MSATEGQLRLSAVLARVQGVFSAEVFSAGVSPGLDLLLQCRLELPTAPVLPADARGLPCDLPPSSGVPHREQGSLGRLHDAGLSEPETHESVAPTPEGAGCLRMEDQGEMAGSCGDATTAAPATQPQREGLDA